MMSLYPSRWARLTSSSARCVASVALKRYHRAVYRQKNPILTATLETSLRLFCRPQARLAVLAVVHPHVVHRLTKLAHELRLVEPCSILSHLWVLLKSGTLLAFLSAGATSRGGLEERFAPARLKSCPSSCAPPASSTKPGLAYTLKAWRHRRLGCTRWRAQPRRHQRLATPNGPTGHMGPLLGTTGIRTL